MRLELYDIIFYISMLLISEIGNILQHLYNQIKNWESNKHKIAKGNYREVNKKGIWGL